MMVEEPKNEEKRLKIDKLKPKKFQKLQSKKKKR